MRNDEQEIQDATEMKTQTIPDEGLQEEIARLIGRLFWRSPVYENSPEVAIARLSAIGVPAFEPLLHALQHPNPEVRVNVIRCFRFMRSLCANVVDVLIQLLDDPYISVRGHALWALENHNERLKPHVEALICKLDDPYIQDSIVPILAKIGPEAKGAIPYLTKRLQTFYSEPSKYVKSKYFASGVEAAYALATIRPGNAQAIGALVSALGSSSVWEAGQAARILGRLTPPTVSAIPALKCATMGEPHLAHEARNAILRIQKRSMTEVTTP